MGSCGGGAYMRLYQTMPIPLCNMRYCIYCSSIAVEKEHLMPMSAIKIMDQMGIMQYEWLAGTCYRCNRIAGARVFETVGAKVDFVQTELQRRGICLLPNVPERLRSVSIVGRGFLESSDGSAVRLIRTLIGLRTSGRPRRRNELLETRSCRRCSKTFKAQSSEIRDYCSRTCESRELKEACRTCHKKFTKIKLVQNVCFACAKIRRMRTITNHLEEPRRVCER